LTVEVAVSYGELFDKISILEIKQAKVVEPEQRKNIENELDVLNRARATAIADNVEIDDLTSGLKEVNERLWNVEDELRDCERRSEFGAQFVELARSVYKLNDRRAQLKRELNLRLGSELIEEKLYHDY
jgi:predicted  nucleic acid-binding Zn-ribbon protein